MPHRNRAIISTTRLEKAHWLSYQAIKSSHKLFMEFKLLQKQYGGRHLWARGYFVASSGNMTDEAIAAYIQGQEGTEPGDGGDNFRGPKS